MSDARTAMAETFDRLAAELDTAARHARTAGRHFREENVPRGCAHALALEGHLTSARRLLDDIAVTHAARAVPD